MPARPSRRPLCGLLRMRFFLIPSQTYPHPEEARSAVSKDAGSPRSISCSLRGAQAIPCAADGVQQGMVEVLVDFLSQPADMHVDHVGLRVEVVVPHVFQEHRPGYDMAGIAH